MVSSEMRHLCLCEKLVITNERPYELLNKRSELFCKCRHENKCLLKNIRVYDKGKLNILTEGKTVIDLMEVYL